MRILNMDQIFHNPVENKLKILDCIGIMFPEYKQFSGYLLLQTDEHHFVIIRNSGAVRNYSRNVLSPAHNFTAQISVKFIW
jgi:hypothetical protein